MRVVVCGGGVVGASTAYYLTKRGCAPTIVERCEIAAEASGKAGGFLARDWNDGNPALAALSRASFDLHDELSRELGAETIDYRRLTCIGVETGSGRTGRAAPSARPRKLENVQWSELDARGVRPMGDRSTVAQVHPRKLTRAMADAAVAGGTRILKGVVTGVHAGSPVCVTL